MAELTKKLQVKVSGTTTPCKIYSTSAEAGTSYVRAKVDNVEAYIPLVDASDDRASKVHIGSKCIATTGKPPYTEKSWTTAGSYTFTVPAGVTRIRVAVCGGGGGGAAAGANKTNQGGSGGTSSFKSQNNSITATGGGGGYARSYYEDENEKYDYYGGNGGSPNGRAGGSNINNAVSGGTGFNLAFTLQNGNYGKGGNADGYVCGAGGSGGYNTNYVDVTSLETCNIQVGAGGAGSRSSGTANAGNTGFVLIAFGGDI